MKNKGDGHDDFKETFIYDKEHKKLRRFLFVITANFISLVAGGYILTVLPF
jgi:hypothetical protein